MAYDLSDYVDVAGRIAAFYAKYPDGSLQSSWEVREIGSATFIVVDAFAYRSPDDERPGQGTAWEPFPGRTPYTKESELMVGQTSAWGRAIAALGFEVKKGIATREDVQNARTREAAPDPKQVAKLKADHEAKAAPTPKQAKRKTLADALTKAFGGELPVIGEYLQEQTGKAKTADLTIQEMDKLIKELTAA